MKDTIVLIRNTEYHFETLISLYKILENIGYNIYVYNCCDDIDKFEQNNFLKKYKVKFIDLKDCHDSFCGFVLSAYPEFEVPNFSNPIFRIIKKIIYISHRFEKECHYKGKINKQNSICLSPLSTKIGVDNIYLTQNLVEPQLQKIQEKIFITTQGHFELENRNIEMLEKIKCEKLIFNFLGTKINVKNEKNIKVFLNLKEELFYEVLNKNTHFLFAAIDEKTKKGTYLKQRYSTNFNQSLALEKPIICHEIFKEIYKVPGFYYNEKNFLDVFDKVKNISNEKYLEFQKEFFLIKKQMNAHNERIIKKKIDCVGKK